MRLAEIIVVSAIAGALSAIAGVQLLSPINKAKSVQAVMSIDAALSLKECPTPGQGWFYQCHTTDDAFVVIAEREDDGYKVSGIVSGADRNICEGAGYCLASDR